MVFYERRNGGNGAFEKAVITTGFSATKIDFGFNATHVKIEVIGAGTCDVAFASSKDLHAQLDDTNNGPLNPAIYENIGMGKLYLKGTSADVKVTAWQNGR